MEEEILELLKEKIPEVDFTASDSLVEDGLLDSITITSVIAELSLKYGFLIPHDEITEENFNSLSAIASLVERLKK